MPRKNPARKRPKISKDQAGPLKLLHTSDWRLGRQLHGASLLEDRRHVLDDVVSRVSGELGVPVIMIGGNHDSGERLEFASRLMAHSCLYITGSLSGDLDPVVLSDEHGEVAGS